MGNRSGARMKFGGGTAIHELLQTAGRVFRTWGLQEVGK